jgi:hydroxypyruvate isomerase
MLFIELPLPERIRKAAELGYDAVEFWTWDDKDLEAIRRAAQEAGIAIRCFQANRGGTLIHPDHRPRLIRGVRESIATANEMDVDALFLLTDELGEDRSVRQTFPELPEEAKRQSVVAGLWALADMAEEAGVTLLLEALNSKVDHPGYWLDSAEVGLGLVREVGSPNLRFLFDIYHVQIMEGNLIARLSDNVEIIGHVHVADVPGRHQPGTGEINYRNVLTALRRAGYMGYVGMEFVPTVPAEQAAAEALALVKGSEGA